MFIRRHIPLAASDETISSLRDELSTTLYRFLDGKAARDAARQVSRQQRRYAERHPVGQIIEDIDFAEWASLIPKIEPKLRTAAEAGGIRALWGIGISDAERAGQGARKYAATFAKHRAAEMVGMRYDVFGNLIENPRARYAITDSTRDMVRFMVREAVKQDWNEERLAREFREIGAFGRSRADLIASTELSMARNKGEFAAWRMSGLVTGTRWETKRDDRVERHCRDNAASGVHELGVKYPSGHRLPPAHPRCRCRLTAVIDREF